MGHRARPKRAQLDNIMSMLSTKAADRSEHGTMESTLRRGPIVPSPRAGSVELPPDEGTRPRRGGGGGKLGTAAPGTMRGGGRRRRQRPGTERRQFTTIDIFSCPPQHTRANHPTIVHT